LAPFQIDKGMLLPPMKKNYLKILVREAAQCTEGSKYKGFLLAPVNFVNGIQVTDELLQSTDMLTSS
jgi:hypothetical protein